MSFGSRAGEAHALNGANLSVGRGETVSGVGESGSGKSTLARAMLGLLPASARVRGGEIHFDGRALLDLSERDMREEPLRAFRSAGQTPKGT